MLIMPAPAVPAPTDAGAQAGVTHGRRETGVAAQRLALQHRRVAVAAFATLAVVADEGVVGQQGAEDQGAGLDYGVPGVFILQSSL